MTDREEFELYAKTRGLDTSKLPHGGYRSFSVGEAYAAWQAAPAAKVPEAAPYPEIPEDAGDGDNAEFWLGEQKYAEGWNDCRKAMLTAAPQPAGDGDKWLGEFEMWSDIDGEQVQPPEGER